MIEQLYFFADENIQQSVIGWLEENHFNVSGIRSENLHGLDDEAILQKTFIEKKIIITQDSDFGKIIFSRNINFYCIIFLRPGHHKSDFHISTLKAILNHRDKIQEGSIIIGVRKDGDIKIRFRLIKLNS